MVTKKFNDIFRYVKKSNIKAGEGTVEGKYPFYTSSSVVSKRIDKALYLTDSLIFGTGGSASIHFSCEPFSTSTDCIVAESKISSINPKFVYFYLLSNIHLLERGFKGAGLKHISKTYIDNIDIPILSLEQQDKIVETLDKIQSIAIKRAEGILLLDNLLLSVFLGMFGDPISNKQNWNTDLLGAIAKLERGRFSPRPRNDPSYFGGDFPFIQTGDINNSNYRLSKYVQTLNERGTKVSKRFNIGDIVIAIVGATIGATSILEIDAYATDSVIAIKPQNQLNNVFLEMLLRFYRKVLLDTAPSAARANINLNILGKLKIIIPPIELQQRYSIIDKKISAERLLLKESLFQIETLQKSITQKVFKDQINDIDEEELDDLAVEIELDAFINKINLETKSTNLALIKSNKAYLARLIDKLNNQEFSDKDMYDKAKYAIFQLMSESKKNRTRGEI